MKKVLVTGGAGFIGSNVVRCLIEKDYEVVVLDNFSTGYAANLKPFPKVKLIEGDVCDPEKVSQALTGVSVVFHLAACVGNIKSLEDPKFDATINILGTLNLLECARLSRVEKIVYSSSAALYGEPESLPIRENHRLLPDSPYGVSKLAAEKYCLAYIKLYGLKAVCLRYFNVYGVNQRYDAYGNVIPIFATRLLDGKPLVIYGDGEQTRDFVNVIDVAGANLAAAENRDVTGVFNVASGVRLTINELSRIMHAAAARCAHIEHQEPRKGEVIHSGADIRALKEVLGYTPQVSIQEGLKTYMSWIAKEHKTRKI